MHELGIVDHVIKQVERYATANHLSKVREVSLEFGEVSGIVPEYLEDCWNWMVKKKAHPLMENAEFKWTVTPAFSVCEDCQKTYRTLKYAKVCPYCHSENTFLLEGKDMIIKQIVGTCEDDNEPQQRGEMCHDARSV